jgi:trigger factor
MEVRVLSPAPSTYTYRSVRPVHVIQGKEPSVLTTNVERLEGFNVKLSVTVPAELVDASIKRAYEKLGTKVRIPGFRKGRAPRPVVDNFLGREYVLTEATEALVEETYPDAIDAESLRPIDSPELEGVDVVVEGEDFTYVAAVELRPELTLTHTDGIAVSVPPRAATEAMIDEQIEIARDRFASLEPVEDRGVVADDYALISFVGDVDGETYEGNEVDKYLYEMGKGHMPPEFDEGLIGATAGEERRVEFVIPETSSNDEYIGKTAGFNVTVHEIKAKVLPEVDDEFALSVGGYDTVAQMREDLRIRLTGSMELQHERAKEEALKAQLAERLEGDVPEVMITQRATQMFRDFKSMLDERGMTVDAYVEAMGAPIEALEADINGQAVQAVKEDLALEALFRAENLEVTEEDIAEEIRTMTNSDEEAAALRKRWEDTGLMPIVTEQITRQRAVKWLYENASITETDGTEAAAADAAPSDAPVDNTEE